MANLTPQQESFCASYAALGNAAWAARIAGYSDTSAKQLGHKLLSRAHILARIAEHRAAIAERDALDRPTLLAKLETVFQQSVHRGQYNVAARAVDLQARIRGFYRRSDADEADPAAVDLKAKPELVKLEDSAA